MKFNKKLAAATAGVALSFAPIEANPVNPALAATITYDFTVDVTTGSLVGTQSFGSFSYNNSTLTGSGLETLGVNEGLSISFDFLGETYNETDDVDFLNFPIVQFQDGSLLGLSFLVREESGFALEIGASSSAPDVFGGDSFTYGMIPDIDGEGVVTYVVPEPSSAMSGLALLSLGLLLKKTRLNK